MVGHALIRTPVSTPRALYAIGLAVLGLAASQLAACQSSGANGGSSPPPSSAAAALTTTAVTGAEGARAGSAPPSGGGQGATGAALPTSVGQALSSPVGAEVVVTGLYLGWEGPCTGAPPTKSAWQLADDQAANAACVYVDGPLHSGLSRKAMLGNPVRVRVYGVIRQEGNLRYLQSRTVEPQ